MTPREIRLLALTLYASTRRVERIPRQRTYSPSEPVEIVPTPAHLRSALVMLALTSPRYEEV